MSDRVRAWVALALAIVLPIVSAVVTVTATVERVENLRGDVRALQAKQQDTQAIREELARMAATLDYLRTEITYLRQPRGGA